MAGYRTLVFWLLAVVSVLISLVFAGQSVTVSVGFAVAALGFLVAAAGMRCPRCGLGLDSRERAGYGVGYVPETDCPKCGRSRKGVWPYQFLFKAERV